MRLLLDECLPQPFRHELVGHDVYATAYMGWEGVRNGRLLSRTANNGFVGLITTDRHIEHQQNLARLPMSVYILHSPLNELPDLRRCVPNLLTPLASPPPTPGIVHVWP